MKKSLLLSLAALAFVLVPFKESKAQGTIAFTYNLLAKTAAGVTHETLTNTDTSYVNFLNVGNELQAVRAVLTKITGTNTSVKVYWQGRWGGSSSTNGIASDGNWDTIDSLVGDANKTIVPKVFNAHTPAGNIIYTDFRLYGLGAGTHTSTLKAYFMNR